MVIMSLASWYIILTKLWDQRRLFKQYREMEKGFWTAGNIRDGAGKLTGKDNAFRMMVEDGLRAAQHHEGRLTDQIPLHEWITASLFRTVDSISNRLQSGLAVLATVAIPQISGGGLAIIAFLKGPKAELNLARFMVKRQTITASTLRAQSDAVVMQGIPATEALEDA